MLSSKTDERSWPEFFQKAQLHQSRINSYKNPLKHISQPFYFYDIYYLTVYKNTSSPKEKGKLPASNWHVIVTNVTH